MHEPLPLPENFAPQLCMIAKVTENGVFHESRQGAALAAGLVASGAPQDLALAEKVLEGVLACQERHPDDPHYGNFMWMLEDSVVQDLSAVEFNLEHLIPKMIRYRATVIWDNGTVTVEAIELQGTPRVRSQT